MTEVEKVTTRDVEEHKEREPTKSETKRSEAVGKPVANGLQRKRAGSETPTMISFPALESHYRTSLERSQCTFAAVSASHSSFVHGRESNITKSCTAENIYGNTLDQPFPTYTPLPPPLVNPLIIFFPPI